jgi:predicted metalloprotease with PDZ domain
MIRLYPRCALRTFFLAGLLTFLAPAARATIRYDISLAQPEQRLFHVRMTIPGVRGEVLVQMPAWDTLYQVRDFAAHVQDVRATGDNGGPLPVVKLDKQTWRVTARGTVRLEYASYWDEPGPFASQLNPNHAFLNFAMVLLYVPERRAEDTRVVFEDIPSTWRIAVELPPAQDSSGSAFTASSYDTLVDAPVEIGNFEEFRLQGIDPPVRVVVHGTGWDRARLQEWLRRIVLYETQLMGGAPYSEYLFILHIGIEPSSAGGGMEHSNGTAISVSEFPALFGVAAHEFFHLWNVKRIRPQSLEPVERTREEFTRALWFAEGVTSTYGSYTLVRSGLWTSRQFLDDLGAEITELEARPARRWQSVEQSSLDAWFEKYPLYRRPDFSISYYNKGQLLGVLLDILIRDATNNRASLDDVLRELNEQFARRGRFYHDSGDIRAAAEHVSGRSFTEFFARYVSGTDELPFDEVLALAGLAVRPLVVTRPEFGFGIGRAADGSAAIAQVEVGSSAEKAGLRPSDGLIALDGAPFPRNPQSWLDQHKPGDTVALRIRRNGDERDVSLRLDEWREVPYQVLPLANSTAKQQRILDGMLRGTTEAARP